jgi:RNA recognition motif-containing protein
MSIFCQAMREGMFMDTMETDSTQTSETLSIGPVVFDTMEMKNFLEKSFLLGESPYFNINMYQQVLEYIGTVIHDKFIEEKECDYDMIEFDSMVKYLIMNPSRSTMLRDDIINNYRFFALGKDSVFNLEERIQKYTHIIDRLFEKHESAMILKPISKGKNTNPTLRVGNLMTCHTREEIMGQLRLAFGKYGVIRDIKIPMDYGTGNPRGYAFIEFMDPVMAEHALTMTQDKLKIGPRQLRIDYALGEKRGFA